ncbi:hypothetical protein TRP8649_02312 [Pelagimonas phthalicica]|uniref:Uncharacterized protein n=1 Tax=Pelagimonas phthalicica TaxID=1037362 RepID=A0A238JDH0_9RHOB|nr:hypothetical protein [Pelagimonas phthalicica]TDS91150.1 hypothetical protein CLV87_2314 [Pelagimonas phthalicica]SMX28197.1 hypothetical protein TRP8649_02312 [Pelagimonas phthalicica]
MTKTQLLEHSIYNAARLRGLAYFNDYDVRYAEQFRRPIRYFIDPAVALLLFVWPGRLYDQERHNVSYLATFSYGSPGQEAEVVDALLSGECLFLTDLDADKAGGETPAFRHREMFPSHWTEFVNRLRSFLGQEVGRDSVGLTAEFQDAISDARNHLEGANEQINQGGLEIQKRLRAERMEAAAARLERTTIMQIAMQRRIRERQLVLPASQLPQTVFRPGETEVSAWSKALRDAGKKDSIRADAKVLAQLDMLNEAQAQKPRSQRVLNVLVTGDHAIHQAFFDRRLEAAQYGGRGGEIDSDGRFVPDWDREIFSRFMRTYTVRHPAQFVATLNQRQMRNKISGRQLFNEVVTGTEAIIAMITDSEAETIDLATEAVRDASSAIQRIQACIARITSKDRQRIQKSFDELQDKWLGSTQHSIIINRGAVIDRMRAARQIHEHVQLGDGQLEKFLEDEQLSLWNSVTQIGLATAAREALGQVRDALVERRRKRGKDETRMPAHLIFDYGPVIGDKRLHTVQEELELNNKSTFDEIDRRITTLDDDRIWSALLLSAVLAARASDWSRLIWYADKTREAFEAAAKSNHTDTQDEGYFETLYAAAIGRRMRHYESDFEEADGFLSRAIDHHAKAPEDDHKEQLRLARALSERGTLRLFEQFRRLRSSSPESCLTAEDMIIARDDLEHADRLARSHYDQLFKQNQIDHFDPRTQNQLRRVSGHVWRQATLNRPFFDLLGHFILPEAPGFPDSYTPSRFHDMVEEAKRAWQRLKTESAMNKARGRNEESTDAALADGVPEFDDEGEINAPLNSPLFLFDISVLTFADISEASDENRSKLETLRADIDEYYGKLRRTAATRHDRMMARDFYDWVTQRVDELLNS